MHVGEAHGMVRLGTADHFEEMTADQAEIRAVAFNGEANDEMPAAVAAVNDYRQKLADAEARLTAVKRKHGLAGELMIAARQARTRLGQ